MRRIESSQSDGPDAPARASREGSSGGVAAADTAFVVRPMEQAAEYAACVELQRHTWGMSYHELVPASLLKVTQRVGGVASGAFTPAGELIGFVYGVTGPSDGRLLHWSHMLAVLPRYRNHGVGRSLKYHQRSLLRSHGVERMQWTFDPLVARNAHLNLNRLGTRVVDYVPDMYGDTGSDLHAFGTDRFVVSWPVADPVEPVQPVDAHRDAPIVNGRLDDALSSSLDGAGVPEFRVEIPCDVEAMRHGALELARAWRKSSRAALLGGMARGYRVAGFVRGDDGRCYYVLRRGDR